MHPKDTDPRDHFCPLSSATGIKKRNEGKWKWRVRKRVILQRKCQRALTKCRGQVAKHKWLQTSDSEANSLPPWDASLGPAPASWGSSRKSSCASARKGGQVRSWGTRPGTRLELKELPQLPEFMEVMWRTPHLGAPVFFFWKMGRSFLPHSLLWGIKSYYVHSAFRTCCCTVSTPMLVTVASVGTGVCFLSRQEQNCI